MSFWMELRCDASHLGCYNHQDQQGLEGKFTNVIAGSTELSKTSEALGWTFVKGLGHVCPQCKERRDANPS